MGKDGRRVRAEDGGGKDERNDDHDHHHDYRGGRLQRYPQEVGLAGREAPPHLRRILS